MIDILKAKKAFKEYVKNYNPNDEQVALKIAHIERTAKVSKDTAEFLKLDIEDIELAELIGLLHDIGRFEQIRRYHTFVDKDSINHGAFGVHILFEEGLIRKFIDDDKYDNIIKKAILNHNTACIESGLNEKELLHAKIIRDSDKTDIYYTLTIESKSAIYGCSDMSKEKITDEIYREYMEDRVLDYKNIHTHLDTLVAHFAYVFDFYYIYGLKLIDKNNYLDKLLERFKFDDKETDERIKNIKEVAKRYLKERLEEGR